LQSGIDTIEIARIRRLFEHYGHRFLERIFSGSEQEYCLGFRDPAPQLAARFAAKEAVAKAMGLGIGRELHWLDMEVCKSERGRPELKICERLRSRFDSISISLTHCREYASAVAILVMP